MTREVIDGAVLRRLREAEGWSREDLAELTGVQAPSVKAWEDGMHYPSEENRDKLMRLFPDARGLTKQVPVSVTRRKSCNHYLPELADRLQDLQDHCDMNTTDLCRKLKCQPSAWWSWRNGYSIPNGVYLRNIAVTFGVSVDYLLGLEEKPNDV